MFQLPNLPYAYDALQPVISDATMHVHHDKHHKKYVDVLNDLLAADPSADKDSLEAVVEAAGPGKLYNNAAQAWNHAFFWESMAPGDVPPGESWRGPVGAAGGWDKLRQTFIAEGAGHFASGWVWLTAKDGELAVTSTHDAGSFDQLKGATPLLICDVWEHAYYLDHKQDRQGFLEQWFDTLANWEFADRQLRAAAGEGEAWRYPS